MAALIDGCGEALSELRMRLPASVDRSRHSLRQELGVRLTVLVDGLRYAACDDVAVVKPPGVIGGPD